MTLNDINQAIQQYADLFCDGRFDAALIILRDMGFEL
jgi:hypothetical protein